MIGKILSFCAVGILPRGGGLELAPDVLQRLGERHPENFMGSAFGELMIRRGQKLGFMEQHGMDAPSPKIYEFPIHCFIKESHRWHKTIRKLRLLTRVHTNT